MRVSARWCGAHRRRCPPSDAARGPRRRRGPPRRRRRARAPWLSPAPAARPAAGPRLRTHRATALYQQYETAAELSSQGTIANVKPKCRAMGSNIISRHSGTDFLSMVLRRVTRLKLHKCGVPTSQSSTH